jgi:hypothetical protein
MSLEESELHNGGDLSPIEKCEDFEKYELKKNEIENESFDFSNSSPMRM